MLILWYSLSTALHLSAFILVGWLIDRGGGAVMSGSTVSYSTMFFKWKTFLILPGAAEYFQIGVGVYTVNTGLVISGWRPLWACCFFTWWWSFKFHTLAVVSTYTRQLQNQNTFLNLLAILNKYWILPERLNKPFRRNPSKISDCQALSLERSVPGFWVSRQRLD